MPSRWRVTLPEIDPASVRLEHLHAVVCRWLDDGDDAHRAQAKPYSVSPPVATRDGTAVEVGLLTDKITHRFMQSVPVGTRVRLGSAWSTVRTAPQPVANIGWDNLASGADARAWCLRFLTPTTFRRGNAFTPSPALSAILGSLRRTWQDFAPTQLQPVVLDLSKDPVWLTDIDVASQVVHVNQRVVSGFTGRLRFVCDGGDDVCDAVDRLVQLAEFAGVGAYTTRGFGMTRQEPTWATVQPRRPPSQPAAAVI